MKPVNKPAPLEIVALLRSHYPLSDADALRAADEIEWLRAALKEIQNNGYRAALCHAVAKTALEQKSP